MMKSYSKLDPSSGVFAPVTWSDALSLSVETILGRELHLSGLELLQELGEEGLESEPGYVVLRDFFEEFDEF